MANEFGYGIHVRGPNPIDDNVLAPQGYALLNPMIYHLLMIIFTINQFTKVNNGFPSVNI